MNPSKKRNEKNRYPVPPVYHAGPQPSAILPRGIFFCTGDSSLPLTGYLYGNG